MMESYSGLCFTNVKDNSLDISFLRRGYTQTQTHMVKHQNKKRKYSYNYGMGHVFNTLFNFSSELDARMHAFLHDT